MRLIIGAAIVLLASACGTKLDESLTDFEAGDCVINPGIGEYTELERVDCTEEGAVRVVGKFEISGYSDEYPGDSVMEMEANDGCPETMQWYLVPTEESWEKADDRLVVCFAEFDVVGP
jgi:hypothetical protein